MKSGYIVYELAARSKDPILGTSYDRNFKIFHHHHDNIHSWN